MAQQYFWWGTGLTGGGNSIDGVDGASISAGDAGFVVRDSSDVPIIYPYRVYSSGTAESSPAVIAPDSGGGSKRWHLAQILAKGFIGNDLTASQPVVTDSNKLLVSLAYTGATSLRKNLALETDDSPTFVGLTLSGLTASQPVITDGNKLLASVAYTGATSMRKSLGLETSDSPTFTGLTVSGLTATYLPKAGTGGIFGDSVWQQVSTTVMQFGTNAVDNSAVTQTIQSAASTTDVAGAILALQANKGSGTTYAPLMLQPSGGNVKFGSYTDASNYERLGMNFSSGRIDLFAETAGTGADNIVVTIASAGNRGVRVNTAPATYDPAGTIDGENFSVLGSKTAARGMIMALDLTANGAGVGGSISFAGRHIDASDDMQVYGVIEGSKVNATSGNEDGVMNFYVATDGGTIAKRMALDGAANLGLGQFTWGTAAAKVFGIGNGTAPTTSPADAIQVWSADFLGSAGDARMHIMAEGSAAGRTILGSGKITHQGTTGGYTKGFAEATATLTGASTTIQTDVPSGARILGVQLRVDTLITSGDGGTTWTAAFVNVPTTAITSGQAFAKNTKFNKVTADEIATGEVDIAITPNAGTFSAGVILAIIYYEIYDAMADAA